MPNFQYRALKPDGSVAEGLLDMGGRQDAIGHLERQGWTPLKVLESTTNGGSIWNQLPWQQNHVPHSALEDFTRSLSSLLAAGVPLSRALTILHKETQHPVAKNEWRELHDRVVDGASLAAAMGRSPHVFPRVYVAMVEAGEAGGFLDVVLEQITDFQSRDKELRSKVLAALMYPSVLLVLAFAVLIYLLVFFIPRFQTLFQGFDAALPVLTQMIVAASHFSRSYGIYFVGVIAGVLYYGRNWITREGNRRAWEAQLLRLPMIGSLMAKIAMSRFCRMLGTLLKAGVPLIQGLTVARRSLGYQTLIDLVSNSTEKVKKGESLASSLQDCRALFPGSTLEMITVAEESGRLDQELVRLAGVTEAALDRQLKTTVALAEPLMLLFIATFIGIIFVGMVIPIFTIQDYIK